LRSPRSEIEVELERRLALQNIRPSKSSPYDRLRLPAASNVQNHPYASSGLGYHEGDLIADSSGIIRHLPDNVVLVSLSNHTGRRHCLVSVFGDWQRDAAADSDAAHPYPPA